MTDTTTPSEDVLTVHLPTFWPIGARRGYVPIEIPIGTQGPGSVVGAWSDDPDVDLMGVLTAGDDVVTVANPEDDRCDD